MEINKNNYPEILIDYLDGKLTALQVAEVLIFLEQNPDIKNEFEDLNAFVLKPDYGVLLNEEKQSLKKNFHDNLVHQTNIDELIVAQMEGDLSTPTSVQVDKLIRENESLLKLRNVFLLTKTVPDFDIKYNDKRELKKSAVIIPMYRAIAVAASLLLLIGLSFLVYNNTTKNTIESKNSIAGISAKSENKLPVIASTNDFKNENISGNNSNQKVALVKNTLIKNKVRSAFAIIEKYELEPLKPKTISPIIVSDITEPYIVMIEKRLEPIVFNHIDNEAKKDVNEFPTIAQFIKNKIIKRGHSHLEEKNVPIDKKENFDALHIASAGADVLNKTTGTNLNFKRGYDAKGKVKSFAIAAGNFSFERVR